MHYALRESVPRIHGGLAQLVEHLLCKQGVNGSNPLFSTSSFDNLTIYDLAIGNNSEIVKQFNRPMTEIFDILTHKTVNKDFKLLTECFITTLNLQLKV